MFSLRGPMYFRANNLDPHWDKVSLLLQNWGSVDNTSFTDLSKNTKTITNTASASSVSVKAATPGAFDSGATSAYFNNLETDALDCFLNCGSSSDFAMGTGDFTWECFARKTLNTTNYLNILFDCRSSGNSTGGLALFINGTQWGGYTNGFLFNAGSWSQNTWYHFAYARSGTTAKAFVDGSQIASFTNSSNLTDTNMRIGGGFNGNNAWVGNLDAVRITKGVARYTASFTKPSAAFPNLQG